MKCLFLLLLLTCNPLLHARGNKTIHIEAAPSTSKYKMSRPELFIVLNHDTFFIAKVNTYKFEIADSILAKIMNGNMKIITMIIETDNNIFTVELNKEIVLNNDNFYLDPYRKGHIKNLFITFDNENGTRRISSSYFMTVLKK